MLGPDPAKSMCAAMIVSKEGPLPAGAHTWQWAGTVADGTWEGRTLTVTLH